MRRRHLVIALMTLSLCGCAALRDRWDQLTRALNPPPPSTTDTSIVQLERPHGAAAWRSKRALSADLTLVVDEKPAHATMTFTTDGETTRIERQDESQAIDERLALGPFFTALPFMLRDPGVFVTDSGTLPLGGRDRPVLRMTFDPHTGHEPRRLVHPLSRPRNRPPARHCLSLHPR